MNRESSNGSKGNNAKNPVSEKIQLMNVKNAVSLNNKHDESNEGIKNSKNDAQSHVLSPVNLIKNKAHL